jgi:hypothetical protein
VDQGRLLRGQRSGERGFELFGGVDEVRLPAIGPRQRGEVRVEQVAAADAARVFGGLGIFLLFVSFAKGISLAPGLGFLVLALVFFIGQRAYQIELTEEKLVYRKLGRKREILIGEIGQILITEGFNSFLEMFTKPRIRIEVHHISDDETKNIYMASSIGIFHPSEIQKILASLRDKASV